MKRPPLRVIPPAFSQLAVDEHAPYLAWFTEDPVGIQRLSGAIELYVDMEEESARLTCSRRELEVLAATLAAEVHPAANSLKRYLDPVRGWQLRTRSLPAREPVVMGILNLTEDSFSGDGVGTNVVAALDRARLLRDCGATIVDVGAESARADRPVMDEDTEAHVVGSAVDALAKDGHLVSIDTYKESVARAALEAGAEIVNDISGLTLGVGAAKAARDYGAGYVLNYSYTVPKRRPDSPPEYEDVVVETLAWLFECVEQLRDLGLRDEQIAIDPGIAFGKSHDEDIQVLRRIGEFHTLGLPVMLAHSRKNFIASVNTTAPRDRDLETHVVTALAYAQGVRLFRVHDVTGTLRAAHLAGAIVDAAAGDFSPGTDSWPWRAGASAPHMTSAEADKAAPEGQQW